METKKGAVIVVILLLSVLVGVSAFYFGKSSLKCEKVECKEPVQTAVSYEDVITILDVIDELSYIDTRVDEITEDSPLSDELVLEYSFMQAMMLNDDEILTLDEVNSVSQKYFGKDVVATDINCGMGCEHAWYLFDEENKVFEYNEEHPGHGGSAAYSLSKYASISKESNVYKIVVYKAFTDFSEFINTELYFNLEDASNGKNSFIEIDYEYEDSDDMVRKFEEYDESKLNKYEYTFEKIGDNYILRNYEMVK